MNKIYVLNGGYFLASQPIDDLSLFLRDFSLINTICYYPLLLGSLSHYSTRIILENFSLNNSALDQEKSSLMGNFFVSEKSTKLFFNNISIYNTTFKTFIQISACIYFNIISLSVENMNLDGKFLSLIGTVYEMSISHSIFKGILVKNSYSSTIGMIGILPFPSAQIKFIHFEKFYLVKLYNNSFDTLQINDTNLVQYPISITNTQLYMLNNTFSNIYTRGLIHVS